MDLHVTSARVGDHPVVALAGIADLATVGLLRDHLQRAIVDHPGATVLVDLDGVTALDDAALGIVLGAAARARESGGDLAIVCTDERLRRRLAVTRFDLAVTVRSTIV